MRTLFGIPYHIVFRMFLLFYFRFEPEVKSNWGNVGVNGLTIINDLNNVAKIVNLSFVVLEIHFFVNIILVFILIQYVMTSSWRHNF